MLDFDKISANMRQRTEEQKADRQQGKWDIHEATEQGREKRELKHQLTERRYRFGLLYTKNVDAEKQAD